MKAKWEECEIKMASMANELKVVNNKCDATLKLLESAKEEHKAEVESLTERLVAVENDVVRLNGELEASNESAVAHKSKLDTVEMSLSVTERELEREKGNIMILQDSVAGVSSQVLLF